MLRAAAATLAGIVAAVALVAVVEAVGHVVFPPPAEIDLDDPAAVAGIIAELPAGALFFVVLGWACGAFGGGYVATKVARGTTRVPAVLVALLLLAATGWTLHAIPHPLWMAVAGIVIPVPFALIGAAVAGRPDAG